jgi:hypothetical protein
MGESRTAVMRGSLMHWPHTRISCCVKPSTKGRTAFATEPGHKMRPLPLMIGGGSVLQYLASGGEDHEQSLQREVQGLLRRLSEKHSQTLDGGRDHLSNHALIFELRVSCVSCVVC